MIQGVVLEKGIVMMTMIVKAIWCVEKEAVESTSKLFVHKMNPCNNVTGCLYVYLSVLKDFSKH